MSSTAPPKALLPKGGWVTGSFVGPYQAVAHRERPDALVLDARVLELVMLPGSVKGLRPSRAPSLRAGAQPPLTQARLEVLAELDAQVPREPLKAGAAPPPPLPLVHRLALRDVFLVDWSAEPLADEMQAARGLVRGTLYARAGPEPWSLWRWLWLLLLLLLLLLAFLLFARCAPLEPVAAPLRRQLAHGMDELRWRVLEGDVLDPDAELLADATRGTGGAGGQGGAGGAGGAGAGGAGTGGAGTGGAGTGGAGTGGAGTGGAGTGGAGAGGAGAAGDAASGQGEGANDSGKKASKDPAPAGADKDSQPEPGEAEGKAPRRYSIDEALDDPAAFFSTCGRPLYLSGDLLFDVDKHTLEPSSRPLLHRLVRLLKEAPDEQRILVIAGHTDPRGEGGHNDELSLRRAETVAAFVAENGGVRRNTLLAEGHGEREPIVPASAPDAQQRFNRRVEVSVRCPGGG